MAGKLIPSQTTNRDLMLGLVILMPAVYQTFPTQPLRAIQLLKILANSSYPEKGIFYK